MISEFEQFLVLFQNLKTRCNSAPGQLNWLAKNDASVAALALQVFEAAQAVRRKLASTSQKYLIGSPRDFLGSVRDWSERWEAIAFNVTATAREEFVRTLEEQLERAINDGLDVDALFDAKYERSNAFDPFDPITDDPIQCIESAIETAMDVAGEFQDPSFERQEKAWGAWIYLRMIIGLDFKEIVERWNSLSVIEIPKHVSDTHGASETHSIYELLREAHLTFSIGGGLATLALCRAIMERILVRNYGCEAESLKDVIAIAEHRFPQVRMLQLDRLRESANAALHSNRLGVGPKVEQVSRFLETLKQLIERAPALGSSKSP